MREEDTNIWCDDNPELQKLEEEWSDTVFNDIGLCGCGDPDAVLDMIQEFLEKRKGPEWEWDAQVEFAKAHPEELMLFLEYILDGKGYTEHGSCVMGAWLTDKGKRLLELLQMDSPHPKSKKEDK